jgi:peptidoglycan/xylan/chitin deacetylase (PgdA/CDA1 family)
MGGKLARHRNEVQARLTAGQALGQLRTGSLLAVCPPAPPARPSARAVAGGLDHGDPDREVRITVGAPIPILAYHEVSPEPHPAFRRYSVTADQFARQMGWLAARDYQTIDIDALVQARRAGGALPRRPVVITFDDGFQGCADHAVPVLQSHRFTAVFYLVTGLMGDTSRWMAGDGVELPLMSWDRARALVNAGFQCGVHTVTHPRLTSLEPATCRAELGEARRRLEDELGRPAVHLAYPFGDYDPAVQASAAEAGYVTACSTRAGLSEADDDLLALHRVTVYGHDSLLDFACRLRTGSAAVERLRRALGTLARRFGGRGQPRP